MRAKNCIMFSIYGGKAYAGLLEMSLKSCLHHLKDIDIYVYHDGTFKSKVGKDRIRKIKVRFPPSSSEKMASRYLFAADLLATYDGVLHLDCDTIVTGKVESLFEHDEPGLALASENPGNYYSDKWYLPGLNPLESASGEYWAGPLLNEEEKNKYKSVPSLCMGIWLAKRENVELLREIYKDVVAFELNGFRGGCVDQHAAVRRLLLNEAWNISLQQGVTHLGDFIKTPEDYRVAVSYGVKVIHCAGGVSPHEGKKDTMKNLLLWSTKVKSTTDVLSYPGANACHPKPQGFWGGFQQFILRQRSRK